MSEGNPERSFFYYHLGQIIGKMIDLQSSEKEQVIEAFKKLTEIDLTSDLDSRNRLQLESKICKQCKKGDEIETSGAALQEFLENLCKNLGKGPHPLKDELNRFKEINSKVFRVYPLDLNADKTKQQLKAAHQILKKYTPFISYDDVRQQLSAQPNPDPVENKKMAAALSAADDAGRDYAIVFSDASELAFRLKVEEVAFTGGDSIKLPHVTRNVPEKNITNVSDTGRKVLKEDSVAKKEADAFDFLKKYGVFYISYDEDNQRLTFRRKTSAPETFPELVDAVSQLGNNYKIVVDDAKKLSERMAKEGINFEGSREFNSKSIPR